MVRLVVAGPGTGKTTYITDEIKKLLEKDQDPAGILALTFTEKASEEMLGRLDEEMPLGYEPPWVLTFHGFCERVLRERSLDVGLDPAYRIITEPEAWILLRQHLYELPLKYYRPLGNPTRFLTALLNFFSRAKDEEVTPKEYLRWAMRQKKKAKGKEEKEEAKRQLELGRVYEAYQKLLVKNSYLDFGDLVTWTIKLFKDRPNILKQYREQFKYIFVDEFQDTNVAQFSLLKLLISSRQAVRSTSRSANLIVVGDDDQAIYKWRGASVANTLEFKRIYPQAKTRVLRTSYRLTDAIARLTYELIQNNNPNRLEVKLKKISKKLNTLKTGPDPQLLYTRAPEEEAEAVLRKVVEMVNTQGRQFKDFAILARANAHLDPFIAAAKRHELPFQIVGNRGLFQQEEVAALLAVLRVIKDPEDNIAWFKVLSIPSFGLTAREVLDFLNKASRDHKAMSDVLEEAKFPGLKIIKSLTRDALTVAPSHLLFDFVQKSGYVEKLSEISSVENQLKVENISLFFQKIQQFESRIREPNIPELVDWLDMLIEAGESPAQAVIEDVDTINLMTVHAAKGLEFPVVFLVSLTSDRFPTRRRSASIELPQHFIKELRFARAGDKSSPEDLAKSGHIEEERRLFYVGATRASEQLFLSFAQNYGGLREKRPSQFIHELGLEVPERPDGLTTPSVIEVKKKIRRADLKAQIPSKLSYSQLEDYKTCPWKYRYAYILKIPAPPTPPMSFGISVHETLREFEVRKLRGERVSLAELSRIYQEHFLSEGYRDKKERQTYFRYGERMLKNFYDKDRKKLLPPFMVERRFEIKLGGKTLTGRIDRIGKDKEGNFELIDFKTGEVGNRDLAELKKRAKRDDQLLLYTVAARQALGIDPKSVAIFYLDTGEKVEVELDRQEIKKRKADIEERIKDIHAGKFKATPGPQCVRCPFSPICSFSEAGRYR